MQRVNPHIPPEVIQAHLLKRALRSRGLEHASRDAQRGVRSHDLDFRDGDRYNTTLLLSQIDARACIGDVKFCELGVDDVGEGLSGGEMRTKVTVALKDVELVGGFLLVIAAVRPSCSMSVKTLPRCRILLGDIPRVEVVV